MPLPPELLRQIVEPAGGRVALVTGAGCSKEEPTSLPLANECAFEAHRRLRADNVLAIDCDSPHDLSCVADDVFAATGGQRDLVSRLPVQPFRNATPNEGHTLAAVLLVEGSVGAVLTLNFDMAFSAALMAIGAGGEVSVVSGPEDHDSVGASNLVYLHRNAHADPEAWILRTESLESEWREAWEETLTARLLSGPVTVFAGLGTPAQVLIETARKIRRCLPIDAAIAIQVDSSAQEDSAFSATLEIPAERYLRMGWVDFMRELASRVLDEHETELERACSEVIAAEGYIDENFAGTCQNLTRNGIIHLGKVRARWMLHDKPYRSSKQVECRLLAHLILAVAMIEREMSCTAVFCEDGTVEFIRDSTVLASVLIASGRGTSSWYVIETEIVRSRRYWRGGRYDPVMALVAGIQGGRPIDPPVPPTSIVVGDAEESIAGAINTVPMITTDELRQNASLLDPFFGRA